MQLARDKAVEVSTRMFLVVAASKEARLKYVENLEITSLLGNTVTEANALDSESSESNTSSLLISM